MTASRKGHRAARTFFRGGSAGDKNGVVHRSSGGRDLKIDRRIRQIVLTNNALRNLLAGGATGRPGRATLAPRRAGAVHMSMRYIKCTLLHSTSYTYICTGTIHIYIREKTKRYRDSLLGDP